jgi:hypothetical protein
MLKSHLTSLLLVTEANAHNNLFDPMGDLKDRVAAYMTGLLFRASADEMVSHDHIVDTCVLWAAMM